MEKYTETVQLLERWYEGDSDALDTLLARDLDWIQSHVRQRLGTRLRARVDTGDIVQDTVVEFLRYGPRFLIHNKQHLRALLARMVENVIRGTHDRFTARRRAIDRERPLRTDGQLPQPAAGNGGKSPSEMAIANEWGDTVNLALELLDIADRDLVLRRDFEGRSFVEMGEELAITSDTARMRYNRAVARLGECVEAVRGGRLEEMLARLPGALEEGGP